MVVRSRADHGERRGRPLQANISSSELSRSAPFGAAKYMGCLFLIYAVVIGISLYVIFATPTAKLLDAPKDVFSEGRALTHVKALTDLGPRMVGSQEIDQAAAYLMAEGLKLVRQAERSRPDLLVQVSQEFYSGAAAMPFLHKEFINMYNNITNVILVVSPRAGLKEKSVLVNAHFDSALGSPGASDDASCVGVILEMARLLIADEGRSLAAPVVFLMNGAEEMILPASHAFMQQSPWAKDIGVFLNLESTGNQGPDFLFQQTGEWPMQSWVNSVPYPRGSSVAQDIFQLGLLPADTDYRFFSANVQGSLPGLDVAFLLGATAYHTDRDNFSNLRRGTVQAMGENAVAFVVAVGKDLALRNSKGLPSSDNQRMVFFDNLGIFMVSYSFKVARLIHSAPLIVALSLPYINADHLIHTRGGQSSGLLRVYARVALEAFLSLLGMATAVLSSLVLGVYRVSLFGTPMSWHPEPVLAYVFLVPAAFGGVLLPYLGRKVDPKIAGLGNVLALAIFSAVSIQLQLGVGFITTIWAIAGCLISSKMTLEGGKLLTKVTIHAVFPIVLFMPNSISLSLYILQKANFLGAQGQPTFTPLIADGVAGAVIGLVTIALVGILPPYIAYASGRAGLRRLVLGLFMFSALFGALISLTGTPYTAAVPKKVFVQHLHKIQPDGMLLDSVFAVGAVDSIRVDQLLVNQRVSHRSGRFSTTERTYVDAPKTGWEWLTMYPFSEDFISGVILQDDRQHICQFCPAVILVQETSADQVQDLDLKRLHLRIHLPEEAYFGALNVTGRIQNWSLPRLKKEPDLGQVHSRYVRFCGKGAEKDWEFWIDLPADSSLSVRMAAAVAGFDPHIGEITDEWPDWVFVGMANTYAQEFTFP